MAETTHTAWRRERFREQQDPFFSIFFCSIRRPYITFKLPRRDKDTPLRLCNLPDLSDWDVLLPLIWNGLCDRRRAEITVMQVTGHSLPVHHWSGTFTLSHIISRAHLRAFFRLLAIGICHIRYLRNCRCDHHRAEITIMQFIGQSLPAHHFFYGTVRIFTLSHIVSQAVFYTDSHWTLSFLSTNNCLTRSTCIFLCYLNICFSIKPFVFPVFFFGQHHNNKFHVTYCYYLIFSFIFSFLRPSSGLYLKKLLL